jgi:membrane fusion protein, multidrug efflux system
VQARYRLAEVTAKRWTALSGTQAVSQQDVDVKTADAAEQKAQMAAAQQEVARYQAMIAFKQLRAPFDGVVTARRTNVGYYVDAAGGDATARSASAPLFSVADIHQMRIFVSVPQNYVEVLRPGLTATLTLPQDPNKAILARFLTTANAVATATRTVVTELSVDNAKRDLWPGTYVNVHFAFPGDPNLLILPEQALLFRAQGMQVAVLDDQDRVHLRNVILGHNLDAEVQIVAGLKATDRVVNTPSLGLLEGQQVKIVQPVSGYQPGQATTPVPSAPAAPEAAAPERMQSGTPSELSTTAATAITATGQAAEPQDGPRPGAGRSP